MSPYELLGLDRDASEAQVRRAYRRLARRWHPDLNPGNATAARHYAAITEAFEILVDPVRRRNWDASGAAPAVQAVSPPAFAGFDFSLAVQGAQASTFGDLFVDVFRQAAGGRSPEARGADIHAEVTMTLADVLHGATPQVTLQRRRACRLCHGLGVLEAAPVAVSLVRGLRAAATRARTHGVRATVRGVPGGRHREAASVPWVPWPRAARGHRDGGGAAAARPDRWRRDCADRRRSCRGAPRHAGRPAPDRAGRAGCAADTGRQRPAHDAARGGPRGRPGGEGARADGGRPGVGARAARHPVGAAPAPARARRALAANGRERRPGAGRPTGAAAGD